MVIEGLGVAEAIDVGIDDDDSEPGFILQIEKDIHSKGLKDSVAIFTKDSSNDTDDPKHWEGFDNKE